MGLIREPLNVDFFVEPTMLTNDERRLITEFIKEDKLKRHLASAIQSKSVNPNANLRKRKGSSIT